MKDMGVAKEFLGLEIVRCRESRTLHLSQQSYTHKVLERFNLLTCNPSLTPMDSSGVDNCKDSPAASSDTPYRQAIGSLMYLMICTKPDLAYCIGKLSQYCESPTVAHWNAVKRVLRYVKGTQTLGIMFGRTDSSVPIGYCDSDWAGCKQSRKSTEGYVFLLSGEQYRRDPRNKAL